MILSASLLKAENSGATRRCGMNTRAIQPCSQRDRIPVFFFYFFPSSVITLSVAINYGKCFSDGQLEGIPATDRPTDLIFDHHLGENSITSPQKASPYKTKGSTGRDTDEERRDLTEGGGRGERIRCIWHRATYTDCLPACLPAALPS